MRGFIISLYKSQTIEVKTGYMHAYIYIIDISREKWREVKRRAKQCTEVNSDEIRQKKNTNIKLFFFLTIDSVDIYYS